MRTYFRIPKAKINCAALFNRGAAFERDVLLEDENTVSHIARSARNLLRYLILGTAVNRQGGYNRIFDTIETALTKRINPKLLVAMRHEVQIIFNNLTYELKLNPAPANCDHIHIFISNLLSLLPFLAPNNNEIIYIPQKN